MKNILLVLSLLVCNRLYAQKCNCANELHYLEDQAERNLPSYQDQVIIQKKQVAYTKHKQECSKIAVQLTDETDCIYAVAKYISFFRDEHIFIGYKNGYFPFSSLDDAETVHSFFKKEKIYPVPRIDKFSSLGIEGLWQSQDKAYIVQIVKHKTPLSDYAGLIIKGDSKFWTKGQLKFLLKHTDTSEYDALYLRPTRQPRMYHAILDGSMLTIGRINTFYKIHDTIEQDASDNSFNLSGRLEFKELSSETNYLRIPDFEYSSHTAIDSIIKVNLSLIISKPNLIIDVRNNSGGADRSYQALLPIIMDNKLTSDPMASSIFATTDIFKYYFDTKYKNCETKQDSIDGDSTIAIMERNIGHFTPVSFDDTIGVDTTYFFPKKVAILANKWCASTTEGFIITASQSKKVALFGENTSGTCSYGDWRTVDPPCLPIVLSMPTKKIFFLNNADYESVGIPPYIKLDQKHEKYWIDDVLRDIEKK